MYYNTEKEYLFSTIFKKYILHIVENKYKIVRKRKYSFD